MVEQAAIDAGTSCHQGWNKLLSMGDLPPMVVPNPYSEGCAQPKLLIVVGMCNKLLVIDGRMPSMVNFQSCT